MSSAVWNGSGWSQNSVDVDGAACAIEVASNGVRGWKTVVGVLLSRGSGSGVPTGEWVGWLSSSEANAQIEPFRRRKVYKTVYKEAVYKKVKKEACRNMLLQKAL